MDADLVTVEVAVVTDTLLRQLVHVSMVEAVLDVMDELDEAVLDVVDEPDEAVVVVGLWVKKQEQAELTREVRPWQFCKNVGIAVVAVWVVARS